MIGELQNNPYPGSDPSDGKHTHSLGHASDLLNF